MTDAPYTSDLSVKASADPGTDGVTLRQIHEEQLKRAWVTNRPYVGALLLLHWSRYYLHDSVSIQGLLGWAARVTGGTTKELSDLIRDEMKHPHSGASIRVR